MSSVAATAIGSCVSGVWITARTCVMPTISIHSNTPVIISRSQPWVISNDEANSSGLSRRCSEWPTRSSLTLVLSSITFMRRTLFIALWTVTFMALALITAYVFGRTAAVIRNHYGDGHSALTVAGMVLHASLIGLPLLGLVLGLLGWLPGTKRVNSQTFHAA